MAHRRSNLTDRAQQSFCLQAQATNWTSEPGPIVVSSVQARQAWSTLPTRPTVLISSHAAHISPSFSFLSFVHVRHARVGFSASLHRPAWSRHMAIRAWQTMFAIPSYSGHSPKLRLNRTCEPLPVFLPRLVSPHAVSSYLTSPLGLLTGHGQPVFTFWQRAHISFLSAPNRFHFASACPRLVTNGPWRAATVVTSVGWHKSFKPAVRSPCQPQLPMHTQGLLAVQLVCSSYGQGREHSSWLPIRHKSFGYK